MVSLMQQKAKVFLYYIIYSISISISIQYQYQYQYQYKSISIQYQYQYQYQYQFLDIKRIKLQFNSFCATFIACLIWSSKNKIISHIWILSIILRKFLFFLQKRGSFDT